MPAFGMSVQTQEYVLLFTETLYTFPLIKSGVRESSTAKTNISSSNSSRVKVWLKNTLFVLPKNGMGIYLESIYFVINSFLSIATEWALISVNGAITKYPLFVIEIKGSLFPGKPATAPFPTATAPGNIELTSMATHSYSTSSQVIL